MGTRSRIGILNANGTTITMYCHWDGYPENQMPLLQENFTNIFDIIELVTAGGISSLNDYVDDLKAGNKPKTYTDTEPITTKDKAAFFDDKSFWDIEYIYLFDGSQWECIEKGVTI